MTPSTITQLDESQSRLEQIDAVLKSAIEFGADCPPRLQQAIAYSLLAPGKRLRPQLVLMAAEACGGQVSQAMPPAVAVEMIHAYSLVHDDLPAMDDDDLRRGRPTCHKQFDEATAVLVGDALQARAFEVLATQIQPSAIAARCCAELAAAAGASALVGGQADDLDPKFGNNSREQLEAIHRRKTGALFRVSLRLGGIVAAGSDEQLDALDRFGQHLGLAFQVTDDLLDVSGSEDEVGKRLQKDSGQGKATYPGLLGVQGSRDFAADLIAQACAALEVFGESAEPLRQLAQFVMRRDR